jgi:hypothetical protein
VRPSHAVVILLRVFETTSLLGSLAWITDYTRQRGWHNVAGRNLLTKTVIIASLLLLGLLLSLFRFNPLIEEILYWLYVALLAAIGPVMVWRMVVFHRLGGATRKCPAGHVVPVTDKYCHVCGQLIPPQDREAASPAR